jgi:hypothetical protein
MKWTKERPKVDGWYWILDDGVLGITTIDKGELAPEALGNWGLFPICDNENNDILFAGPIPEPED